jgi:hypothetical protein
VGLLPRRDISAGPAPALPARATPATPGRPVQPRRRHVINKSNGRRCWRSDSGQVWLTWSDRLDLPTVHQREASPSSTPERHFATAGWAVAERTRHVRVELRGKGAVPGMGLRNLGPTSSLESGRSPLGADLSPVTLEGRPACAETEEGRMPQTSGRSLRQRRLTPRELRCVSARPEGRHPTR